MSRRRLTLLLHLKIYSNCTLCNGFALSTYTEQYSTVLVSTFGSTMRCCCAMLWGYLQYPTFQTDMNRHAFFCNMKFSHLIQSSFWNEQDAWQSNSEWWCHLWFSNIVNMFWHNCSCFVKHGIGHGKAMAITWPHTIWMWNNKNVNPSSQEVTTCVEACQMFRVLYRIVSKNSTVL